MEDISVTRIDSFTVYASSYQMNYLPSANTGAVLIGKTQYDGLGSIKSTAYFQITFESFIHSLPTGAQFESANIYFKPTAEKYYYGDTTQNQTFYIHKLSQTLTTENILGDIDNYKAPFYVSGPTIFNYKKFNYENTPIGNGTFKPFVNSVDSFSIDLDYNFGKDLFDKIVSNEYEVSTNDAFQEYLKGIVVVPDENNTAILGLNDTVYININYSYIGSDGFKVYDKKVLSTATVSYRYNNIEYDRTGTLFATLNETNNVLPAQATNNNLYVQSGTGLATKISIPSLNQFMENENIGINKAELIIETESVNYGKFPVPTSLMLMVLNKNGIPTSYVPSPFSNAAQQVNFIKGTEFGEPGKYVFNLIDYVKYVNTNRYLDTELLITTSSSSLYNSVNTFKIATENGKPKIKLNIVYTKFK